MISRRRATPSDKVRAKGEIRGPRVDSLGRRESACRRRTRIPRAIGVAPARSPPVCTRRGIRPSFQGRQRLKRILHRPHALAIAAILAHRLQLPLHLQPITHNRCNEGDVETALRRHVRTHVASPTIVALSLLRSSRVTLRTSTSPVQRYSLPSKAIGSGLLTRYR